MFNQGTFYLKWTNPIPKIKAINQTIQTPVLRLSRAKELLIDVIFVCLTMKSLKIQSLLPERASYPAVRMMSSALPTNQK